MKTALVWFTTDLRLHDNEALIRAIEDNDQIIPIYCFDNKHYVTTPYGFKKTGAIRTQFVLQALKDLDNNLRQIGSGLITVEGNTPDELYKLAVKYNAIKIYAKKEIADEELQVQKAVTEKVASLNCELEVFDTSSLFDVTDLPFSIQEIPDVFTDFRKKVEQLSKVRLPYAKPNAISSPAIPHLHLPDLAHLGFHPVTPDTRAAIDFYGGESSAVARVHYYFEESKKVSTYKETRNQLLGADYSTKFSAWLALGCLSPRYIYQALKQYEQMHEANESTYWVVFELLWRDYFRLMLMKFGTKFFLKNGINGKYDRVGTHNNKKLMSWVNGETGVDFVDANMLELKLTGFMSNRGRQNVASFLCNDLKLDWRYGAAYFEQQLIDYDVCSNWGNWAYIAGVGNDPRPNRYFNIQKQAAQYDADKQFRKLWCRSYD